MNRHYKLGRIAFVAVLIVLSIVFVFASVSGEDDWEEIEEKREEIEELEQAIIEMESSVRAQEKRVRELEAELQQEEERLERAEEGLEESQQRLADHRELFGERVRSIYMNGSFSFVQLFFKADSFGDIIFWTEYFISIFQQDSQLVEELRAERDHVKKAKEEIEEDRKKVENLYEEAKEERENLKVARQQKEEMLYEAQDTLKRRLAQISTRAEAPPVYGVAIDNHRRARPQEGFAQAQRVYEYEVEGGLTRYLALYAEFPTEVGPVRSARQHSIILALENGVHFVHSGSSADNLRRMNNLGVSYTDGRYHNAFWRSDDRSSPHNLYGNIAALGKVAPPDKSDVRPIYPKQTGTTAHNVSFTLSSGRNVRYVYDSEEEIYWRYLDGSLHRDAGGNIISARNVIIQYVDYYRDARNRPTANLIGEGRIDFYSNGQHFQGTWKKESKGSPTRYYYENGEEIEIPYGSTWIQLQRR